MKEKLIIIKIGSHILDDASLMEECLDNFSKIKEKKILMLGGGDYAIRLSDIMEVSCQKVVGRRITTKETLVVVTMAYAGKINKSIVAALQALGCNGIGLTGADGNCIQCHKREVTEVDYGLDRKSTRLNSSHVAISYAVFC